MGSATLADRMPHLRSLWWVPTNPYQRVTNSLLEDGG
jgi:hypothetical protein